MKEKKLYILMYFLLKRTNNLDDSQ